MRIKVRLPQVKPDQYQQPTRCPYAPCTGQHFKPHGRQGEPKAIRDLRYAVVQAYRWRCLACGRTFRVYPQGVGRAQQSLRLQGVSVFLYVLGLSYGAAQDLLEALGVLLSKTTVYSNVQAAGEAARRQQAQQCRSGGRRAVLGTDGTYVKVMGREVAVQVVIDDADSGLLSLEIVASENAAEVLALVRAVAESVEAEVLVSDDLDTYKGVADALGLDHQICRSHVKRNVDDLAGQLTTQLAKGEPRPAGVTSSPAQLIEDLGQVCYLVRVRPAAGEEQLAQLYARYQGVPPPVPGRKHTVWWRMRMLITRLWERWGRLTLDQRRQDLDGTNNSAERMIGWWIKERYRTMRGYKREDSIRNVVGLTALLGANVGAYDLTRLYA
jgi:transposase-like protein